METRKQEHEPIECTWACILQVVCAGLLIFGFYLGCEHYGAKLPRYTFATGAALMFLICIIALGGTVALPTRSLAQYDSCKYESYKSEKDQFSLAGIVLSFGSGIFLQKPELFMLSVLFFHAAVAIMVYGYILSCVVYRMETLKEERTHTSPAAEATVIEAAPQGTEIKTCGQCQVNIVHRT